MRSKFKWIFSLLLAFSMQLSFAQEKTVTGVVTDKLGPLPGANVVVKGSTNGVQTDFDGKYSIKAKAGDVLQISFTGYDAKSVTVGSANSYNVVLTEGVVLDEVVVVGYGTSTKERFTGTATKVTMENIEAKAVTNVSQALRGEVAGVNVVLGSGAPGSEATIRIRGFGSINGNRNPLYVVDGAPFSSDISAINPADIESMVVLKDAAATSIYGSRGSNGVILITTKQGKSGKSQISVDFKTSVNSNSLPAYDVITSPEEYIELSWKALKTKGALLGESNPAAWASANLYSATGDGESINNAYNIWNASGNSLIDPSTGKFANGITRKYTPTKWSDAAFGTGYRSEANLLFSGGNEKTKYATSFGFVEDQGVVTNSSYKRYTTRINLEHKPKEWLTASGNISYTGAKYTNSGSDEGEAGSSGNIFALTSTTPAIYDIFLRDTNGDLVEDPIFGGNQYDYGALTGRRAWNSTNAIADAKYDRVRDLATTLLGNFNFKIDITKDLAFETRYSGQYQNNDYASRNNPFYGGSAEVGGSLFKDIRTNKNQNFLQLLRYSKTFGRHNLETFVAHESTQNEINVMTGSAQNAVNPYTFDLAQYTTATGRADSFSQRWAIESYFAQLNYDFSKKYFLTASVRRDGSSRFIKNKWGTFGSVGLGWIASKESFLSNVKAIDYLKFKASLGSIADQGTNVQYGFQTYSIENTVGGLYSFLISNTAANRNQTWESAEILQVGLETVLFGNSLEIDVDYYVKNTNNLFFNQAQPGSFGFATLQINDGQLRNSGLEFDVLGHIFKAKNAGDFSLSVGVNGEILENKITQMPRGLDGVRRVFDTANEISKGRSQYDWFMREWAGVDPANGSALWNLYYNDVNGNGIFDDGNVNVIPNMVNYLSQNPDANVQKTTTSNYALATQKYVGKSAIPTVRGAFRINAGFKNLDLTAQFGYSLGGYAYDSGYALLMSNRGLIGADNFHTDIRKAWSQPGDVTDVPRTSASFDTDVQFSAESTRFLIKSDYLSLNNIRLGYTIPKDFLSKMMLSNVNLFVSGDNLFVLSARNGFNPTTIISTTNTGIYTPMTTLSFGAKIEF
ncbi:SusC/RagA family TonB-linked outer membrane protein [Flavobacterium dankookense]|uniref:TonB-linked SusC/RagA family outer membrane protein n=1 Tax=Flavobacterium dankookense TaxID=706186 RepID=A0A4R6Q8C5_9FLAO|nr:SusC/RagA family TonB-linked outer membrane protein [Flavobacterium dankookense]TDP58375.1 TonB-linked SusC/RagA family outer membrane protein [Flavobacterium dankookense]